MSALCLTGSEIEEITGKKRASAQLKELRRLAIDAKQRSDGRVLVFRHAVEPDNRERKAKPIEPDFSAL